MITKLLKILYLRLRYRFFPNEAQEFWAQELLESQGLTAKIGQVLAQGKVSKIPKSTLRSDEALRLFLANFNESIHIEDEVLAASMGQVFFIKVERHKYALKMLHPGIRQKLHREIDNIILLGKYFARTKGFNFDEQIMKRFLEEVFEEETDLKREAHFQERFRLIFADDNRFLIPQVIRNYSNDIMLCQERVDCVLARDLESIPHYAIFDFFFHALFHEGLLHGDLNDRNWGLQGERVVIYDFGCSQIVSDRRIQGLIKLFLNQDTVSAFRELGVRLEATWFKGKEQELRDALFDNLIKTPLSPDWSYTQVLRGVFGDKIKILREHTDPWVLLMMRSLFSLIRVYQDRQLSIPLGELIRPHLKLKEMSMQATQIKVEVKEGSKQVVYLELPMTALENLEDTMPGKVSSKLLEEGISIAAMIKKVQESHFAPQELFHLSVGNRNYRVWVD